MTDTELKLLKAFPKSFINCHGEFIAHERANEYFILHNCKGNLDIKCKVLERLSRAAYKTEPYRALNKNNAFHAFMLSGINDFLGTEFTSEDMDLIYTYLGNAVNHELTMNFIQSGYDMTVLKSYTSKAKTE